MCLRTPCEKQLPLYYMRYNDKIQENEKSKNDCASASDIVTMFPFI